MPGSRLHGPIAPHWRAKSDERHRHAKSNYTAIKPAYNSRSQAPEGAPQ